MIGRGAQNLVVRRGVIYEGNNHQLWALYPMPLVSPAQCADIKAEMGAILFREDSFDPLTRIRRGRLYREGGSHVPESWHASRVSNGVYGPLIGAPSSGAIDTDGRASILEGGEHAITKHSVLQIGSGDFWTAWRVVDLEANLFGQQVLTLRGQSLLGALPELATELPDQAEKLLEPEKLQEVRAGLDRLVDTYHRLQPVPTVDAARETARVILAAWIGQAAKKDDLGDVLKIIQCGESATPNPENRCLTRWAGSIVNRIHPRGKSAEQEKQSARGAALRPVVDEDAECAVHLVGLLLREIGWAQV